MGQQAATGEHAAGPGQAARCWVLPGLGAEGRLQQAADLQRLFYTSSSSREKSRFIPKSFMAFEMCAEAHVCHMWPPARLRKHPRILLCRYSCLQMEEDDETNEK